MTPSWIQRVCARLRADAGFTLIEVVVALGIATGVLTAFAYVSTGTLHALQIARLNQQGTDLATQRLEQLRAVPFGSLGHDPAGIVGDPNLSTCDAGRCYQNEPLVITTGGLKPQITTPAAANNFQYTLYTYVTQPDDVIGEAVKRVTVVAQWSAYGRTFSKTMSTVVTQTQRGLPLPEFKLTPVGPSTITVNPGAAAAFGFQLNNQGAPDQWNISSDATQYRVLLDNGDDIFNAAEDTQEMTDHNGDGKPDTGRLEPKQSIVFWLVRDVPANATSSTSKFTVTAEAVTHEGMDGASASVTSTLVVTTSVVSPTPTASGSATPTPSPTVTTCPASSPAPTPSTQAGYTVKGYVLHNTGATSWPTFPLPASGAIPGSTALDPMYMDMNPVSIPANRDLPVYSTDLTPAGTPGRLLYAGGTFSSTSASSILDFRTQNPNRSYAGTMVLRLWVKPVSGTSLHLAARPYKVKTKNMAVTALGSTSDLSLGSVTCNGFQEAWFSFSPGTFSAGANTVLGVRVWNVEGSSVQVAYDHGAYPATFTVVEK